MIPYPNLKIPMVLEKTPCRFEVRQRKSGLVHCTPRASQAAWLREQDERWGRLLVHNVLAAGFGCHDMEEKSKKCHENHGESWMDQCFFVGVSGITWKPHGVWCWLCRRCSTSESLVTWPTVEMASTVTSSGFPSRLQRAVSNPEYGCDGSGPLAQMGLIQQLSPKEVWKMITLVWQVSCQLYPIVWGLVKNYGIAGCKTVDLILKDKTFTTNAGSRTLLTLTLKPSVGCARWLGSRTTELKNPGLWMTISNSNVGLKSLEMTIFASQLPQFWKRHFEMVWINKVFSSTCFIKNCVQHFSIECPVQQFNGDDQNSAHSPGWDRLWAKRKPLGSRKRMARDGKVCWKHLNKTHCHTWVDKNWYLHVCIKDFGSSFFMLGLSYISVLLTLEIAPFLWLWEFWLRKKMCSPRDDECNHWLKCSKNPLPKKWLAKTSNISKPLVVQDEKTKWLLDIHKYSICSRWETQNLQWPVSGTVNDTVSLLTVRLRILDNDLGIPQIQHGEMGIPFNPRKWHQSENSDL